MKLITGDAGCATKPNSRRRLKPPIYIRGWYSTLDPSPAPRYLRTWQLARHWRGGLEGWLMKLIGHVAQPHDKRSAVTSLAGQDVIIGSCTRLELGGNYGSKQNQIRSILRLTNTFDGDNTIFKIIREKKTALLQRLSKIFNFKLSNCIIYTRRQDEESI